MIIQLTQDVDDGEHRTEFWDRLPRVIRGTFGLDIELEMQEPGEDDDDNLNVIPTLHKLKSKIHQFSTGPFDALTDGKTRPFRWQLKSTDAGARTRDDLPSQRSDSPNPSSRL